MGVDIGAMEDDMTNVLLILSEAPKQADYDCTDKIGQLGSDCEWPMYSYERPAYILWNAIAQNLHRRGWTDKQIKEWLQSKNTRWALDGDLGAIIQELGDQWATDNVGSYKNEMQGLVT
jgi:predicted transcriptional regulator